MFNGDYMNKELFKETENLLENYNKLDIEIKLIKSEIEGVK